MRQIPDLSLLTTPMRAGEAALEAFWKQKQAQISAMTLTIKRRVVLTEPDWQAEELIFHSLDTTPIVCWYIHQHTKQRVCTITTHGFKSRRGLPQTYLHWLNAGSDVLVFDARLQGGESGYAGVIHTGMIGNVLTLNIDNAQDAYVLALIIDGLVGLRVLKSLGYHHLVSEGTSQAGGLALALAALDDSLGLCLANVPSYADLPRRVLEAKGSFASIRDYLKAYPESIEQVQETLWMADLVNLAPWIHAQVSVSAGGLDEVCPLRMLMPAYEKITAPKELIVYPLAGHEGGGMQQTLHHLNVLEKWIGSITDACSKNI